MIERVRGRRNRIVATTIYQLHCGLCGRCGQAIDATLHYTHPGALTIGHVIPISKGGTNVLENLRPEHRRCNLSAGNREPRPVASPVTP